MAKMCPRCGVLETQREFVGAFCIKCFEENEVLFEQPKLPELRHCTSCGRYFLSGKWEEMDERTLGEWIEGKIKAKAPLEKIKVYSTPAKNGFHVAAEMVFNVAGHLIKRETSLLVRVKEGHCDNCLKRSGGYHEAVIQVRGENKERVERLASKLAKLVEQESVVTSLENKKEGIDLQVASKRAAMQAVMEAGKHFTVAHKLIGVKEGKRVFRSSICIRL